ncbi:MAG: DUF1343 domain-containing protein [Candidatus Glassbacteria bacterium]|nr:DUF1343 domain-containing protein [Candidatus Glassbacteria bacterium]
MRNQIITGADRLLGEDRCHALVAGKRAGVVVNQTAVTSDYTFWPSLLASIGADCRVIFSPEHGLWGAAQDQVACASESAGGPAGAPVVSLYGNGAESLKPRAGALSGLEVLVFDIQDIGSRYYTFIYTMAYCMEAAAEAAIPFVVLDRPNPLGGEAVEGPPLEPGFESFVGRFAGLPVRHGLTAGELAHYFHRSHGAGAEPLVVPVQGWTRDLTAFEYDAPWVAPSPNMPTPETALVYPGMCLLEGTNLSEGRGTTRPFETFGAPYLEPFALAGELNALGLPGVRFRPARFLPTFDKHRGLLCSGAQLHVTDRRAFRPFETGMAAIQTARRLAPQEFAWRPGAYEFVEDIPAIDLLFGSSEFRLLVESGAGAAEVIGAFAGRQDRFAAGRREFFLYPAGE